MHTAALSVPSVCKCFKAKENTYFWAKLSSKVTDLKLDFWKFILVLHGHCHPSLQLPGAVEVGWHYRWIWLEPFWMRSRVVWHQDNKNRLSPEFEIHTEARPLYCARGPGGRVSLTSPNCLVNPGLLDGLNEDIWQLIQDLLKPFWFRF